jgi:uncharacterized membrane protein
VTRDAEGKLSLNQPVNYGLKGTALGALMGGLIGTVGGAAGAAIGAAVGAILATSADATHLDVGMTLLRQMAHRLENGDTAIVAELADQWSKSLQGHVESIGGSVLHE